MPKVVPESDSPWRVQFVTFVNMKIHINKKLRKIVNEHNEGFTMIELIMAIVISGIVTAVALPKFDNISNIDVHNAARQVKSDIRYAQELAMSNYRKTTINFTSGGNTYNITGVTQQRVLPPSSKAIFDSSSTTLIFTFNAYGEPIDDSTDALITGGAEILTISSGVFSRQIAVSNITGNVGI